MHPDASPGTLLRVDAAATSASGQPVDSDGGAPKPATTWYLGRRDGVLSLTIDEVVDTLPPGTVFNGFREVAETELLSLHEGNFARYVIRPSEFAAWRDVWNPR
jgi:hypothetical protein